MRCDMGGKARRDGLILKSIFLATGLLAMTVHGAMAQRSLPPERQAAPPGASEPALPTSAAHLLSEPNPPQPATPGGIDGLAPVVGYLCVAETDLWVQTTPCSPTQLAKPGMPTQPGQQRPLNRQTLCRYLALDVQVGPDLSAGRQSDERSRLIKEHGCGGDRANQASTRVRSRIRWPRLDPGGHRATRTTEAVTWPHSGSLNATSASLRPVSSLPCPPAAITTYCRLPTA